MSKKCDVCGKAPIKAAKLTFSHKQIVHTQEPKVDENEDGLNFQFVFNQKLFKKSVM